VVAVGDAVGELKVRGEAVQTARGLVDEGDAPRPVRDQHGVRDLAEDGLALLGKLLGFGARRLLAH
jgi:hypothetical protein